MTDAIFDSRLNPKTVLIFLVILMILLSPSLVYGAYYGNQFRAVAITADWIDADGESYAFRFTAQESKTIDKVAFWVSSYGGSGFNFSVGIEGDDSGSPDGTYIDDNEIYVTERGDGGSWSWFDLATTVSVTNQTVYHITCRAITANSTHRFYFRGTRPRTTMWRDTYIVTHNLYDSNVAPLYSSNGADWSVRDRNPCFVVHYTDETYLGVPYDHDEINSAYCRVYGSADPYQTIIPTEDVTVNTLGVWTRKLGSPSDLNISLVSGGQTLRYVTIDPADGSALYSWEQDSITLITLNAFQTYYLYFESPDSDSSNYWEIRHPYQTGADSEITALNWGGTDSRAELSSKHDYTFRLNITDSPEASPSVTSFEISDLSYGGILYKTFWYSPLMIVDDVNGLETIGTSYFSFETDYGWHNISYNYQTDTYAIEAGSDRIEIANGYTEFSGTSLRIHFYLKCLDSIDIKNNVDVYCRVTDTSSRDSDWSLEQEDYFNIVEYTADESTGGISTGWDPDDVPAEEPQEIWIDSDGDGIPNWDDDDVDGDGLLNEDDPDIDGDTIPNEIDPEPFIPVEVSKPSIIFSFKTPSGTIINIINPLFYLKPYQKIIVPFIFILLALFFLAIYSKVKDEKTKKGKIAPEIRTDGYDKIGKLRGRRR